MRILLSGGNGLVGHNVIEAAPRGVHELLAPTHKELDLSDQKAVLDYLKEHQPDMVIHAAGLVGGIAVNSRNPFKFLIENMDMGRNLINGALQSGVKKFINIGSSCMYPRNMDKPLTEDMILTGAPTNEGFALAKIVCARMCSYINREHADCQYKTLIPCNLYGRWDKFTGDNAHMIPAVIHKIYQAVADGRDVVEIWGSGAARREFMYAGDLADCIWYSVEHFDQLPDMMNVGLGYDYTVNEYYETIADVIGFKGRFTHDLTKPEGMKQKLTEFSKQKLFGWEPKIGLREGVRRAFDFYKQHVLKEVPMEKIGIGWAYVSDVGKKYVNAALDAGRLSQGEMVHRFEKEFARLHDQKYGIALNSGTGALHVGLEALKEKFNWLDSDQVIPLTGGGDNFNVIVPAITFIASSNACLHAGLQPRFVDVDPKTYNLNPELLEDAIDENTVAIMPVHLFGQPCEMDPIVEIAQRHGLKIIEDCAEAHFATYKGKKVGSFGEIAGFSTYVAHTITTGVGGVVTTNDRELMEISRSLLAHGRACTCEKCVASDPRKVCPLRLQTEMDKRFMFVRLGYSYRIGELEGALGLDQLESRDFIMNTRLSNATYLTEHLQDFQEYLQLPWYPNHVTHSFMMYPIVIKKSAPFERDDLTHWLEHNNIETRPMMPLLNQPIYKKIFGDIESKYPIAEWINHHGFYIGCHHGLTAEHLDKIVDCFRAFFDQLNSKH